MASCKQPQSGRALGFIKIFESNRSYMVFCDLVKAEWPIRIQEASLALRIAEPPLHGPEIGSSGKDVHARIEAATLAEWMKIQGLYAKHATRAWISGLLGEPGAALANGVMPVERAGLGVAEFRD